MDWYFVGVDFGQTVDYTAIAVLERAELQGTYDYVYRAYRKDVALRLRFLERIPLDTPYPEVVERVVQVTGSRQLASRCHLAADGTGVGKPVVDLLRDARPQAILMPVTVTSGLTESTAKGFYRVPKRDLIVGLQILLQRGKLQIAAGMPFGEKLVEELLGMEVKVSSAGNEKYAAWREGTHDDLVFAVALAYWSAQKAFPDGKGGSNGWWTNKYQDEAARMFKKWKEEEERMRVRG